MKAENVGIISAAIYTGLSLAAAGIFFGITLAGSYDWVTRIGGASWVFLLTMIVLMPVVTPIVNRRLE